ncbi:retrovirus-related pol polyprotein from transposon tnt 1-94 [Lasius niger]|uniref:Retrovirus-related pol polyprotein from transposon tnt 1-94 n=1 Tax=Lasius niger TaxID=67767 RepID=A0A0J7MS03_LASNI|nr:retrovirus-related pol polyprotein from transposon tnt 1-94 [Lasius niger]
MSSSNQGPQLIEKLKGRGNYQDWRFAMRAWLEYDDLWECVIGTQQYVDDPRKVTKSKIRIILSLEPVNYVHVEEYTTAKEVWEKLQAVFEDSGLTRKVNLLRTLVTTQLDKCKNVEEYVNIIIKTAHKLNGIGLKVPDDWIETLLLGLPEEYRPMIMGLENSGTAITADFIKTKLLEEVKNVKGVKNASSNATLYTKKPKPKKLQCFRCKGYGHFASKCKVNLSEQPVTCESSKKNEKKTNH